MTKNKLSTALLLPLLLLGCKKHSAETPSSRIEQGAQAANHLPSTRIITKDPQYIAVLNAPDADDLLKNYSDQYKKKVEEIDAQTATISDPDLRARATASEISKINVSDYVKEANTRFLAVQIACLTKHRNDWFEIGHVEYPGTDYLHVQPVEASPLAFPDVLMIPMDVTTMDEIYTKFHNIAWNQIDALTNQFMANISEDWSDAPRDQQYAEAEKEAESQIRAQRLVLVGQGDLLDHRIDKLLLVDYETETIFAEFPGTDIQPSQLTWRFDLVAPQPGAVGQSIPMQ